jgi:hypothetical protein
MPSKTTPRKRNQGSKWIRKDKRLAIYLRDGLSCVYCGRTMEQGDAQLTLDHVTPVELGGSNRARNLVTCCMGCNCSKQDKPVREFVAYLDAQGADTQGLAKRVRKHTRRSIKRWRRIAKDIINNRD